MMTPAIARFLIAVACAGLLATGVLYEPDQEREPQPAPPNETPASVAEREPLRLRYLANEGFLVEVGDVAVLFDAFLAMPYAGYPAMTKPLIEQLRRGEGPFAGIDLALTSHAHADHFQERVARDFLIASPDTPLATTPQAIDALESVADAPKDWNGRLHGHYPKPGKIDEQRFGDLHVRFLRVPHGGMPEIENLGTLLTIGGHVVLHLGDADVDRAIFEPYEDVLKRVDVALVPHWFYATPKGRDIIAEYLPAKTHVAMHFAKRRLTKTVTSFLENHDGVHAFSEPLQEATFD